MQWNSGIWWWGHCLWWKKVKPVDAVDAVHSGRSTASIGLTFLHQRQCAHHHIPLFLCVLCPLHTASTTSTSLTFLHQRQCPHHHIPLFHCVLHTTSTASTGFTFLHQRQYPHHHSTVYCIHCILHPLCTVSTAYCVHCVHCMPYMAYIGKLFALTKCPPHPPMLLVTHETITNQKLVISNQYLMSPPPTQKVPKTYTFLAAWPI